MKPTDEHVQPINDLKVADVTSRITAWFTQAQSGSSIDELEKEVSRLCHQIPFETLRIGGDGKFFRARLATDDTYFDKSHQLWYPPVSAVKTLGRANQIGSPMLYLAGAYRTTLFELSPAPNQHIAIAEIGIRENMSLNLQHVGVYNNIVSGKLATLAAESLQRLSHHGYTQNGINNIAFIHRLLGELFMRDQ